MSPQAGWYDDPNGMPGKLRYWDGVQWTDQCMDAPGAAAAGAGAGVQPQTTMNASGAMISRMLPGQIYPMTETDRTLRLIAFIWNILCTIGCGVLIVPLAWMIPMTVHSYGIYKGTKANTVGFDVCTLIFIGLISGILLLCSKKDA